MEILLIAGLWLDGSVWKADSADLDEEARRTRRVGESPRRGMGMIGDRP
jgi:hypothetical protein